MEQDRLQGLSLPELEQPQQPEQTPQQPRYLMEAGNGMLVSVPEDRLEDWQKAQGSGELSPGLRKYKQSIKDRILQEIYGGRR